jgi:hypothetical protein
MDSSSSLRLAQVKKATSSSSSETPNCWSKPNQGRWRGSRFGSGRISDLRRVQLDRQAHFHGKVREAIIARADELFATPPVITPVDVLASKLPGA